MLVQTANPDNTKPLTGNPKDRRKWIDWALFHVEHDYLQSWHSYHHALRNRNALLRRSAKEEEYYVWESIGEHDKRLKGRWQKYLGCLQQYYQETADQHICAGATFTTKGRERITPVFLVGDLTAELDKKTVGLLLDLLYKEKMQMFITATDPGEIVKNNKETTLFHVEQGHVKNVRIASKNKP